MVHFPVLTRREYVDSAGIFRVELRERESANLNKRPTKINETERNVTDK